MANIANIVNAIANDLEQGLDKALIIQYWTNKLGHPSPSPQAEPEPTTSRPRARRGRPTNIEVIQNADRDDIIERMAAVAESYSYTSIAEAMYGEGMGRDRAFKVKKWALGLQNPTRRSIEEMRAFLIGLERGDYEDVLGAPGGNRRS